MHIVQFKLRLPDNLRGKIQTHAKTNKRSMNAEIVAAIENGLDGGITQAIRVDWAVAIHAPAGVSVATAVDDDARTIYVTVDRALTP